MNVQTTWILRKWQHWIVRINQYGPLAKWKYLEFAFKVLCFVWSTSHWERIIDRKQTPSRRNRTRQILGDTSIDTAGLQIATVDVNHIHKVRYSNFNCLLWQYMDMFIYSAWNVDISKKCKTFFFAFFPPKIFGTWKLLETCVTILWWLFHIPHFLKENLLYNRLKMKK